MARVVVVSNRVSMPSGEGGRAGGLEVAIRATLKRYPGLWFGWSGRVSAPSHGETTVMTRGGISFVVTDLTEEDYGEYYSGFANRVLWPILHYRLDLAEFSRRELGGYLRVNEHFADKLHGILRPDDLIWVHDYHLLPLAQALRTRGHKNKLGFFLHIPLPPPDILCGLPHHERLIPALCQYDLVGFQTDTDAENFARYLIRICKMPTADRRTFRTDGHRVQIGVFPVGIETAEYASTAQRAISSPFTKKVLDSLRGALMIIGVDRLDYSKGITQRMDAFERFLVAFPEWRGKVTYLQITPKSRSDIPEYASMNRQVDSTAGRINGNYGDVSWTPIRYVNRAYSRSVLAGLYRAARVGLVTPLRDGMNLVAKEFVAAQNAHDPGVLILSQFAGTAEELEAALVVNPYDPDAVSANIARALSMPLEERRSRQEALFHALLKNDVTFWGERFLAALQRTGTKAPLGTGRKLPMTHLARNSEGDLPVAGKVDPQVPS
ncbi:MAG: alpha,alpha-trehalose-phosphate synthase (UDP-forming) [Alphaproteobacteria bacterium]